MRSFVCLSIAYLLLAFGCASPTKKPLQQDIEVEAFSKNLDEYFKVLASQKKFNGGVFIQKEGQQVLFEVYHMNVEEGSSLKVTKESQFDIHSISKLMAQAVIVDLEMAKLIDRTDKVSAYISDFPKGDLMTIQQLIDNASGLPRGFSSDYPNLITASPEQVIEYIKLEPLLFEPGADQVYSNLGYQLLYFIIAKIQNKPFVQVLDESFFKPLEMTHSGAHFHLKKDNLTQMVTNHELDDGALVSVPNIQKDGKNQSKVYSSMGDLMKFIQYVKQEPYQSAMTNKNSEIGWSGGGNGILSHAKAALGSGYEVVLFSNYDEIPFGQILQTVEKIMTNQPFDLPEEINRKAVEIDINLLKKYVGKYQVKVFNNAIFEFRVEGENLVFYQDGERNSILFAETENTFFDEADAVDYFEFVAQEDERFELIFHYKQMPLQGEKIHSN